MENNNITNLIKSLDSLYIQKEYGKSIELLLRNKESFDQGLFHYNLGTLHAKLNHFAIARYNLEKAYSLGQVDTKNINNLDFVKEQLNVNDISNSDNPVDQGMSSLVSIPAELYLSVTLFLVLCLGLLWFKKKISSVIPICLLFAMSLAPYLGAKFYLSKFQYAINLKEVQVYEGPSKVYEKKLDLEAGSKILINGPGNGWYFIEKPISLSGWIEKKNIGFL